MPQTLPKLKSLGNLAWRILVMAHCEMDPANLKSFQRISQEDLRYLKELGAAAALAHAEKAPPKLELKQLPAKLLTMIENTIERLFFETVPAHEVYASRE